MPSSAILTYPVGLRFWLHLPIFIGRRNEMIIKYLILGFTLIYVATEIIIYLKADRSVWRLMVTSKENSWIIGYIPMKMSRLFYWHITLWYYKLIIAKSSLANPLFSGSCHQLNRPSLPLVSSKTGAFLIKLKDRPKAHHRRSVLCKIFHNYYVVYIIISDTSMWFSTDNRALQFV